VEHPAEPAGALTKAHTLAGELSKTYRSIRAYADRHLARPT
jgi:hypothetical protein